MIKIYKCNVSDDPTKCLEDNNSTVFYEEYHCNKELYEPASGFKTDDSELEAANQKKEHCFIMNVKSKSNENDKIPKLFCISDYTLDKDLKPVTNEF